jgi:hypothetical protein
LSGKKTHKLIDHPIWLPVRLILQVVNACLAWRDSALIMCSATTLTAAMSLAAKMLQRSAN